MIINLNRKPVADPYTPPTWAGGTDAEIVEALNKHYAGEIDLTQYWSVGDERTVSLSAMSATGVGESHVAQDVTMVLMNVGGKTLNTAINGVTECAFIVGQKNGLAETGYMNSSPDNYGGWKSSQRRTWCNSVYKNAFPSTLVEIFKEHKNKAGLGDASESGTEEVVDTFALPAEVEVFGSTSYSVSGEGTQFKYYETSGNRAKKAGDSGSASGWWERSPRSESFNNFCYVTSASASGSYYAYSYLLIAPFGVI